MADYNPAPWFYGIEILSDRMIQKGRLNIETVIELEVQRAREIWTSFYHKFPHFINIYSWPKFDRSESGNS